MNSLIDKKCVWYVGIDLSTTKTGFVVINSEKELIINKTVNFKEYTEKTIFSNVYQMCDYIISFLNYGVVNIGIEVSNFSNPLLTQKFSTLAGAIIGVIEYALKDNKKVNINFKLFNSNAWQQIVPKINNQTKRADRKLFTKEYFRTQGYILNSEDEYDALGCAYWFDLINSTLELKKIIKEKETIKKKKKKLKEKLKEVKSQKIKDKIIEKINSFVL